MTPPAALAKLLADRAFRELIARHPRLDAALARACAADLDPKVRAALPRHDWLDAGPVRALAADPHPAVRAALALRRPDATVLVPLADDQHESVRLALAANPHFKGLAGLAADPSDAVRLAVARRDDAPKHVLEALAGDTDPRVRKAAQRPARVG